VKLRGIYLNHIRSQIKSILNTIQNCTFSAGHPYLTGLAIAGGVFYLGFEGALFGPILLCCLFVAFNMYSSLMQESANVKPLPHNETTPHSTLKLKASLLKRINSSIQ
jgi:hypothetical protein